MLIRKLVRYGYKFFCHFHYTFGLYFPFNTALSRRRCRPLAPNTLINVRVYREQFEKFLWEVDLFYNAQLMIFYLLV